MKDLYIRFTARPLIAAELVAASFFANLLALASPLFVIQVLNRYVAYGVDATLATLTAGVVIAIILEFAFRQLRQKLAAGVNAGNDRALSGASFDMLIGAKASAMDRLPPGLQREAVNATDSIQAACSPVNVAAVLDVPFALLFVAVLAMLSPLLAVIVACFLAAVFLTSLISLSTLRGPTRDLTSASGRRNALVSSAITAADTVRAFNSAPFLRQVWAETGGLLQGLKRRIAARQGIVQTATQSAQALMGVTVIAVGALQVVNGNLDVGAMIGANILAARALGSVVRLAQLSEAFAKARQSFDLLREFARVPHERLVGSVLGKFKGTLEFRDVAFSHSGDSGPLFESLSLKLEPGAVLVVTGANGVGKTTLARLMAGLLEPTRGQILIDGVDLTQIQPEWWRRQLVYMPQEPRFFNASLRDNLLAFNPELDEKGFNAVIDSAGLRRFINESPKGFDTPIVEDGSSLSLGIRRRLALARALAGGGQMVVVDEPTEGLDLEGSQQVYKVLNNFVKQGSTIIAFSHDPQILKGTSHVLDLNSKPVPRMINTDQDTKKAQGTPNTPDIPKLRAARPKRKKSS